ncbi:MAG: FkbM family methyltransferase [Hyphomicrobiales bacterium]|nr:FkbM family methyltransferase [Hyphomicrobiales bacterium]
MIIHDFQTGRISGAGISERIGLELMRLGANILAQFEFVGFSWIARIARSIFRSSRPVRVIFSKDCVFEYPYGDGYWGVLLHNKITYAPEIEPYLKAFSNIPYVFIDCGSNYGYMSVLTSSAEYGSKPTIAVEADRQNFQMTARNAEINGSRYTFRHNAVFSKSGEKVTLGGTKHEARSINQDIQAGHLEEVDTLALDDLSSWLNDQADNLPVILKLDVEGAEIDALKGAGTILERDCLIIYEEHGADKSHEVSRYLKDVLGMRLFASDEKRLQITEISNYDELDVLKTNPRKGYDLFASFNDFWIEHLGQLNNTEN